MSEIGDVWAEIAKYKKHKKVNNISHSIEILDDRNIKYITKNNIHYIVEGSIDFWPSTGLFIIRGKNKKRRGIFNLLKHLNK